MRNPDRNKRRRTFTGELWRSPRLRTVLIVLIGCVLLYTLLGFFGAPFLIKSLLDSRLETALDRPVNIERVKVNPFSFSMTVESLSVQDKDGEPFFGFEELFINLDLLSAVKRAPIMQELRLSAPHARLLRTGQGAYNFSDLIGRERIQSQQKQTGIPRFSVRNLKVESGSVDVLDRVTESKHALNDLFVSVPFLSSLQEDIREKVPVTVTAGLDGAPVLFSAECLPFAPERTATLSLNLMGLDLPRYLAYFELPVNIRVRSCYVDADTESVLTWAPGKNPEWSLTGHMGLSDVDVADQGGTSLLDLPQLDLALAPSDPLAGRIHVKSLSLKAPEVWIQRSKNGEINLLDILPQKDDRTVDRNEAREPAQFDVVMDDLQLADGRLVVSDLRPTNPVDMKMDEIVLDAKNMTTRRGETGSVLLRFRVNERGSVTLEGNAGISPPAADLRLNMEDVGIRSFGNYIEDNVRLGIIDGHLEVDGRIALVPAEGIEPSFQFKGEASLVDLKTVDLSNTQELLSWESLYTSDIDFKERPAKVSVGKVALTGLYARVIISPEGRLNILDVFGGKSGEQESEPVEVEEEDSVSEKESQLPISLGTITLQGGNILFSDRHVKPNFEANMRDLGGRISELSSKAQQPSDVLLEGKLENQAPLEIKGTVNPWGKEQVANLNVLFNNIELAPFNPYSERYLGRAIRKGKLSLNLAYQVSEKTVFGSNQVFLNQLIMGDEVAGPEATTLPIEFAIALLKDREGNIQLDFPVSGDLGDPQFNFGQVILKVIGNLFTKIITSPFAAIGAALEGTGDRAFIDFQPGLSTLDAAAVDQLNTLAKALYEHPKVTLDIQGDVAPEDEREAVRQIRFDNLLRAEKEKSFGQTGRPSSPRAETKIKPEEYETYLRKAYESADFSKPRDTLGNIKALPAPEMEKLLSTHIEITDQELLQLARARAYRVRDRLLSDERIDPARIFTSEPETVKKANAEERKSRAVLTLK
ncbi:MAG: DUF748 domain-containing protein [Deltaproteobacteria bacterium]|nr:DUF748 domain-containing protein [Deltaproteobacteria bacterium]